MACCGKGRKTRGKVGESSKVGLYGAQGLVMVEYGGEKSGELPGGYTGIRYPFYPGRRFYVDANDLSRVLAWSENGRKVVGIVDAGAAG